jgi:hypothetical protein
LQRLTELPGSFEPQGYHENRQRLVDHPHDVIFGKHVSPNKLTFLPQISQNHRSGSRNERREPFTPLSFAATRSTRILWRRTGKLP